MKINSFIASGLLATGLMFVGCGGGSAGVSSTTITAVDGYIEGANVTDDAGQVAIDLGTGKYRFSSSPAYPLHLTGGAYLATNASFDMNMTAQSGFVISPITTFLENNSTLLDKLIGLKIKGATTLDGFEVDYEDTNDTELAKLSQLLYLAHKDPTLLKQFKASLGSSNPADLNEIFTLLETDVNDTNYVDPGYAIRYRAFLTSVHDLSGNVSDYEVKLETDKANVDVNLSSVTHNGTTYGAVISQYTGEVWLNKNLGASQVCTDLNITDLNVTACYGDYYQWGGEHESNSSTMTSNSNWMTSTDSDGSLRAANWSKTDGSSVCPVGYRVPTITELEDETTSRDVNNSASAFNNFLKLPSAGYRDSTTGSMTNQGTIGNVWSSSVPVSASDSSSLNFSSGSADTNSSTRANGYSVRCIKD